MNWGDISKMFSKFLLEDLKKYIVLVIERAIGISGGLISWIIGFVITKESKALIAAADSAARLADQKKKDEELLNKYKKDEANATTPESTLIEDEQHLLNGGRP